MNEHKAVERLRLSIQDFADGQAREVERNSESPHLAALLVQSYGYGIVHAIQVIYGEAAAQVVQSEVDHHVNNIDHQWLDHAHQRRRGHPADIILS